MSERPWTTDAGDGKPPWFVKDGSGDLRAQFLVRHDAERYVRDRNREAGVEEISDREARARDKLWCNHGKRWEDATEDERLRELDGARREGYSEAVYDGSSDQANAKAYVGEAMRSRLDDLHDLLQVAEGQGDELDLTDYGVDAEPGLEREVQAVERLDEYPLCIEETRVFEIVLSTGGPDSRLVFECPVNDGQFGQVEIQRVLFRYSWSGSAEIELHGEDRRVAEEFASRVMPQLEGAI